jgi:hypothetical protein
VVFIVPVVRISHAKPQRHKEKLSFFAKKIRYVVAICENCHLFMNKSTFIYGLLLLFWGSVFGFLSIKGVMDTCSFLTTATPAQGTVIELLKNSATKPKQRETYYNYRLLVEFTTKQGKATKFESKASNNLPAYTEGEQVEILYNPESPQSAVINSWGEIWGGLTIAIGVSSVCVLFGGWLMFMFFPSQHKN